MKCNFVSLLTITFFLLATKPHWDNESLLSGIIKRRIILVLLNFVKKCLSLVFLISISTEPDSIQGEPANLDIPGQIPDKPLVDPDHETDVIMFLGISHQM